VTALTDRMRTCAAHIMATSLPEFPDKMVDDAAKLLVEAAHEIDILTGPIDLGEPMEVIPPVIPPVVTPPPVVSQTSAMWVAPGGQLPLEWARHRSKTACPKCDSRTQKKVYRTIDRTAMLVCPVCAHEWAYKQ